jgi:hypothetical protein
MIALSKNWKKKVASERCPKRILSFADARTDLRRCSAGFLLTLDLAD